MRRLTIVQGEFLVVDQPDVMVATILGSCIAVCLVDRVASIGGINHFVLAAPDVGSTEKGAALQRYGVHAMELLINGLLARGGTRNNLSAHVYGGANMIAGLGRIGTANADFAFAFLGVEGIPITHADTGGRLARRVEFRPCQGRSRCRLADATDRQVEAKPLPLPLVPHGALELF